MKSTSIVYGNVCLSIDNSFTSYVVITLHSSLEVVWSDDENLMTKIHVWGEVPFAWDDTKCISNDIANIQWSQQNQYPLMEFKRKKLANKTARRSPNFYYLSTRLSISRFLLTSAFRASNSSLLINGGLTFIPIPYSAARSLDNWSKSSFSVHFRQN